MGQGYSVIHPQAGSAGIDAPELGDLEYERTLGGARFLKTIRARHKDGVVVAKVYTKPYATLRLDEKVQHLIVERRTLLDVPNALPYHRIIETTTSAYIVRQYVHSSLYDRISTNPPLEDIERKWIAFQLLCAVRDCHARNIYHGDIKTENMLVTSWNWLYVTDFAASIKPHFLPEDNPVEYTLFYDSTSRRICYIAPERFTADAHDEHVKDQPLQWAMDIFSVGCVIAELFTEKPTFTLSQLFRYRKGEYDPAHATLSGIKDDNVREMVTHMLSLDPNERYSAEEYLNFWREKAFPLYFYDFLHQYTHLLTDPYAGRKPVIASKTNSGEADERIDRIYFDFDKIAYALGLDECAQDTSIESSLRVTFGLSLFPLEVDIPNNRHSARDRAAPSSNVDNGVLLFSNIVIASLRSTARASSRIRGCELLLAFSEHLTDEAKLDRVLPYAMALLDDEVTTVRIAALRTITQLLSLVSVLSPMNAFIFPRYILPRLQKFLSSSLFSRSSLVRATYASCLSSLANTANRFLDMTQALKSDGSLPSTDPEAEDDVAAYAAYQTSYDVSREEMVQQFEAQTKIFLTDEAPDVRRAFLSSVPSLCVFFGDSLAADLILTHLNTYLNDQDWTLKCAFFETIVGVAAFIGGPSLEDYILPLMVQALSDPEETVTEQVIRSLSSMSQLGLFQRWIVLELVMVITRFTLHPNQWIREAATQFLSTSATHLTPADVQSLIQPLIKPVLKIAAADTTEVTLLDALKKPLPRPVVDLAKVWASKVDKGHFWKLAQNAKSFSFDASSNKSLMDLYKGMESTALSKSNRNEEDNQWLARLKNAGMRTEDEVKLVALRDYIWRNVLRSEKESARSVGSDYNHVVSLTSLKVPLQNVLFDDDLKYYDQIANKPDDKKAVKPLTLADALKDAALPQDAASIDSGPEAIRDIDPATLPSSKLFESDSESSRAPSTSRAATKSSLGHGGGGMAVQSSATLKGGDAQVLSSSPRSQISTNSSRGQHQSVRHKESAMNLIRRAEAGNKAVAETGTESVVARGRLDVPHTRKGTPRLSSPMAGSPHLQGAHSYAGADPTLKKYLDSVYSTNFPMDIAEFGPLTQAVKRTPTPTSGSTGAPTRWKPQGQLVAALGEHTSQVNCMAVAPDHTFFITGSEDGSIRIWDTSRLERNITHRSRQIHQHTGGPGITSLCFVESTHCFISTASDGSLNVVKVDVSDSNGTTRYGKLQILRDWNIEIMNGTEEHVVSVDHFRSDTQSICMLLTTQCRILALDLRTMDIIYELSNPVEHGTPTAFCLQRRRQWLLVGTSHGVLDLWDLRFRLRLRSWTFRNSVPINQITLHPGRKSSHRMRVCISGGTAASDVSIWDIEKLVCTELFQTSLDPSIPRPSSKDLELINLDDAQSDSQLARIVGGSSLRDSEAVNTSNKQSTAVDVTAFAIKMHVEEGSDPNDARQSFLLSAGPDWRLRFWDPDRLGNSSIINGADPSEIQGDFSASLIGADTRFYLETAAAGSKPSDEGSGRGDESIASTPSKVSKTSNDKTARLPSKSGGRVGAKATRYDVIRNSAQHLLKGHRDGITCVALVERPFGMVVSATKSGMIYVFQ